jgi:hypothetical protein
MSIHIHVGRFLALALSPAADHLTARGTLVGRFLSLALSPAAYRWTVRDALGLKNPVRDDQRHLDGTIEWLLNAQRVGGTGGVPAWYCFGDGWHAPYPEATGYTIPTCLEYGERTGRKDVKEAAIKMGEWSLTCQDRDGGVYGGTDVAATPVVFNTAQCMQGWQALAMHTGKKHYGEAIRRAADWLVSVQDEDGKWSRFVYQDEPHVYSSLVAWQMLEAARTLGNPDYRLCAVRNLEWCMSNVQERSWIRHMAFSQGEEVLTHTLAYTYDGLLACEPFLEGPLREKVAQVSLGAAEELLHLFERRKKTPYGEPSMMPGTINGRWKGTSKHSCVTGNAQIACIWLKVFHRTGDWRYVNAALKIIDQVKKCHDLTAGNSCIRGGLPSSYPIYGDYLPMRYLSWAAKFFADSLMLKMDVLKRVSTVPS